MSFINKLSAFIPFGKKEEQLEYYFALNIGNEELTAALWTIEGKQLKILETASDKYLSTSEIAVVADKLLDAVLGIREIEPQKILFGVPSSWLRDDNLKDEFLKILRGLVKELELTPMAYVASANALIHLLEKLEGVPTTAILAGFEPSHLTVAVVRAGKLDGVKVVQRGEISGSDLEKALLTFTSIETLPSKILIFDSNANLDKLKTQLLSFSWMSKLSFLHFPKIEVLSQDTEIKSVCLAGASELNVNVVYTDQPIKKSVGKQSDLSSEEEEINELDDHKVGKAAGDQETKDSEILKTDSDDIPVEGDNFGFVVGDVSTQTSEDLDVAKDEYSEENFKDSDILEKDLSISEEPGLLETEDFEEDVEPSFQIPEKTHSKKFNLTNFFPKKIVKSPILFITIALIITIIAGYIFIPKAVVKIFVEPKILEKDAQVIADPAQKTVDENAKVIPGQVTIVEVSGSAQDSATGQRQIGDPAKGTVKVINNTNQSQSFSRGSTITSSSGEKFTLDTTVNIASTSAVSESKSTATVNVTAVNIGADGNLPSGTQFNLTGGSSQVAVVSEGNFSGGTSKQVTVVSSDDQKRLLAKLSSDLRLQAQQQLQGKLVGKKILQEALSEEILKKSYNKNISDQASNFSLSMSARYKGTAFDDADLRLIVSKLVTTQVPDQFQLDLSDTETQADVSKLDKDGKLFFLARFKAKLIPKIDMEKVKNQIKGKTPLEAAETVKGMENVLGSDISIKPVLPAFLQRLPFLTKNITIEVGLK